MRYMVIEHFTKGARPVYERAREWGRMLPEGLAYIDSWIDERTLDRCWQLMETDDPALFDEWFSHWSDLGTIEVVPVIGSAEAGERALA
ncbi:MAG TPA: DUF3303 family protein [Dehalococcoidia bacterium]|nr:DUF3303 family protein [Dehalococcoidia bacterium]